MFLSVPDFCGCTATFLVNSSEQATTLDAKFFITGDNNEVFVSTAQETKIALAEVESKLQSLITKEEELSQRMPLNLPVFLSVFCNSMS